MTSPNRQTVRRLRQDLLRAAFLVALVLGLMTSAGNCLGEDLGTDEYFEKQVRPILVERCGECHGAAGKAKGGLRLVSRESILKGGDSGPAAVPGKPAESLLVDTL